MPAEPNKPDFVSVTRMRQESQHHFRKVMIGLAVVMALGMAGFFSGAGSMPENVEATRDSRVVANVAGRDIRDNEIEELVARSGGDVADPRTKLLMKASILQALADQAIQVEAAKKANLTVTDEELKKEQDKILKETASTQLAGLSKEDREKYEGILKANLRDKSEDLRNSLLVQKWSDTLAKKLNANDTKIAKEDLEVRARHILIRTKDPKAPAPDANTPKEDLPLPEAEAKKKIEEVLAEAKKPGANFTELAKKYSQEPGSETSGGDLGWFGTGRMVPEFEQAAFGLKSGEISPVVKTQFGYHVLKVEDRRVAETAKQRLVTEYMEKARKTAKVDVSDEALAGIRALNDADAAKPNSKEKKEGYAKALTHLQAALQKDKGNAGLHGLVGDVYRKQYEAGNKKDANLRAKAIEHYETAVKITPAPRLALDLSKLYEDAGKKQEALAQLKQAAQVAYVEPYIRYDLKSGFERLGAKDLAAEQQKMIDEMMKNQGGMNMPLTFPSQ